MRNSGQGISGATLKHRRLDFGLTQKELAKRLGISQSTLSRKENCKGIAYSIYEVDLNTLRLKESIYEKVIKNRIYFGNRQSKESLVPCAYQLFDIK